MTRKRYEELMRAGRHRVVKGVLLRAAASVTLLLVGYYLAPLDCPLDPVTLIALVLALAVVGAVVAWQVRTILASDVPLHTAVARREGAAEVGPTAPATMTPSNRTPPRTGAAPRRADERARAGRALMITRLFRVALGAFRWRVLVLSPTDDHHGQRELLYRHPASLLQLRCHQGVRVPVGTRA